MKCPNCGAAKLVADTRDIGYAYKGQSTTVPAVTGEYCPSCEEVFLEQEQGDRYSAWVAAFQQRVNATHVDPQYIVRVRKKLQLGQREAGDIFGGGANAFSRYENGKTRPPQALVKLLRVLDRHPDLLEEVRAA
jgi:HTH-type transcriptional regulator / antitoxin MqsA